jgi:hypothetical protein
MHDLEGLRREIARCRQAMDDATDPSLKGELAIRLDNLTLFSDYLGDDVEQRQIRRAEKAANAAASQLST